MPQKVTREHMAVEGVVRAGLNDLNGTRWLRPLSETTPHRKSMRADSTDYFLLNEREA